MFEKKLLLLVILSIINRTNQQKLAKFADLQEKQEKCKNQSQILKIRYEKNLVSHGLQYVCQDQAYRTCCTKSGFDQIVRERAFMMSKMEAQDSNQCMYELQELLCYDCDGDVGLGIKRGLCKNYCQNIYNQCTNAMFMFSDLNKIRLCKEDDLLCSKLKDITQDSEEFCKYLGHKLNQNEDYTNYIKSLSDKSKTYDESCYNGIPSYQQYGRAKQTKYQPRSDSYRNPQTTDWYYKIITHPYFNQYFPLLASILFTSICFGLIMCLRQKRNQQQLIEEQERNAFIERHKRWQNYNDELQKTMNEQSNKQNQEKSESQQKNQKDEKSNQSNKKTD